MSFQELSKESADISWIACVVKVSRNTTLRILFKRLLIGARTVDFDGISLRVGDFSIAVLHLLVFISVFKLLTLISPSEMPH